MATEKILEPNVRKQVKEYLKTVKAAGIVVSRALVFGSHARGAAHKWSDIDLAVVSPQFVGNRHEELVMLFKLVDRETKNIEPMPLSPSELEDKSDPLAHEIRKYGKEIPL